jgi:hypothetical protein
MRRDVRRKLIQVAKDGMTITYGQLMKEFHIPRGHPTPGVGIGYVVGTISEYEDSKGRPLLSAIVVRSGSASRICPKGSTGGGFFGIPTPTIPSELKRTESRISDPVLSDSELRFLRSEQEKAWKYWATHVDDEQ